MRLKADLHLHTNQDPEDFILKYNNIELIDYMAENNFDVISITHHNSVAFTEELRDYAATKNILLIPGVELTIQNKHVVVLGNEIPNDYKQIKTFSSLRSWKHDGLLYIAPHPFFPNRRSLWHHLWWNIDIFDAIEYNAFFFPFLNFNLLAKLYVKVKHLPLIGNSDGHFLELIGTTYSYIDAEKTVSSVLQSIKHNHIKIIHNSLKLSKSTLKNSVRLALDIFR